MPRVPISASAAASALVTLAGAMAATAFAQPTPLTVQRVATGLSHPVWAGAPAADPDRLFIIERANPSAPNPSVGAIRILDLRTRQLQADPFLTVPVATGGDLEQGLLGLAFHPDFLSNGYFWINYTDPNGAIVIARYRALGDPLAAVAADPASATTVLTIPQPATNHNGGWLEFGPDGYLYIATGDGGGSAGWPAQDADSLLGKILRIDVDGPDNIPGNDDDDGFPADPSRHYTIPPDNPFVGTPGADEIWALGLRNPWRNDFDPLTGDLFIADVGLSTWEEINFQPAHVIGTLPGQAGYQGGRNYGWPCFEGNADHAGPGCGDPASLTFPFLVYAHTVAVPPTHMAGCSVTGGVVYRGCAIPDLQGAYFFADLCAHRIFSLRYDGDQIADLTEHTAELVPPGPEGIIHIVHFGRDGWGELYIVALTSGNVFKVVPAGPFDINGDHVADLCRCPADWNGDGITDSTDISAFITAWLEAVTAGDTGADYDLNGITNSADIAAFITSWINALSGGC